VAAAGLVGWLRKAWLGWLLAWPGWLRKPWLGWLLADVTAGVIVLLLVCGTTSKPLAFAAAAAAAAVVVLPVYFLPTFVAHARRISRPWP